MFQENSSANALDQAAQYLSEPAAGGTSRRQFINHAGRGLLAAGIATALPLAAAEAADLGGFDTSAPPTGPLDIKLPPLEAPTDPRLALSRTPTRPTSAWASPLWA